MADLFRSYYEHGRKRRGLQDAEDLWDLLAEDETITVVEDPVEGDVEGASKKLESANEKQQERIRNNEIGKDPEKDKKERDEIAALSRTASFQPLAEPTFGEDEEDESDDDEDRADRERGRQGARQGAARSEARS